jgi:hypothetical protein
VRLVQRQIGNFLANHAARADRSVGGGRQRSKARIRSHDGHEEIRRRRDQGRAARLTFGVVAGQRRLVDGLFIPPEERAS